jgi:delta 1-pyrroline-5-carboxylate dehydrogenase
MVMEIATMIRSEFPGRSLSGIGGVETGRDAAEFILLGSDTVQVCTGVMKFGYAHVKQMCDELLEFMEKHKFATIADFKGKSLDYFTTHAELVRMQTERKAWPGRSRGSEAGGEADDSGVATPSSNSRTTSRGTNSCPPHFRQRTSSAERMARASSCRAPSSSAANGRRSTAAPAFPVHNPSTGEVIAEAPACNAEHVNAAVEAAAAAYPEWWETPPVERARIFFRFKMLLEDNFEELVRCNTREHGKTLVESRGDVRRGIEMVEFACGIPSLLSGETIENIARGIDCEAIRQPLGVCVGITPFNFPAMVPLWMYPVALVCGNTFVLKPSEKVPLTAIRIAQLLEQAGIPKGVFNIVHGGRECVDALLTHPKVRAISFVGSRRSRNTSTRPGTRGNKRVQANGGAKNFVFLMPDADVENSTRGVVEGAFGCAGERCMASSTAVVIGSRRRKCCRR